MPDSGLIEAKPESLIPRGSHPSSSAHAAGCVLMAAVVLLPAFLYFGFFAAILVDEVVRETGYIGQNLPRDVRDVAEFVYAPMFLLVEGLGIDI